VSCGRVVGIQFQHRGAVGHGGSKVRPRVEEGVTSCWLCNPKYEHVWQTLALVHGWKVRRWVVLQGRAHQVPVYVVVARQWYLLTPDGERVPVGVEGAREAMRDVYGAEWDEWVKELAA
jgi:hypothetical protein